MHAPVSRLMEEVMDYHLLCRLDATEEELQCMPREDFGSEKQPGVLRIVLQLFGKYEENFVYRIDEGKIRNMKSIQQLVDTIKVINSETAEFSQQNRKRSSKFQPPNLKPYNVSANASTPAIDKAVIQVMIVVWVKPSKEFCRCNQSIQVVCKIV